MTAPQGAVPNGQRRGDAVLLLVRPRVGDTLRLQSTMVETKPRSKRPDVGMTRSIWEMFNQHGDKVLHMEGWGMFRRRTPASAT